MDGFADSPGQELQLAIGGGELEPADIVDAVLVEAGKEVLAGDATIAPPSTGGEGEENLFAAGQRIAARAASASTRGQYAGLYRRFGDWLNAELGRPATVADLTADAIAAYARHLETRAGRGGRPAALATRRVQLTMVRALARELGLEQAANDTRVPRHRPGPPEVISHVEYQNLLRVPDRRSVRGKRDHALLRVLGDCGLRAAEACGLTARSLRRPRANGCLMSQDFANSRAALVGDTALPTPVAGATCPDAPAAQAATDNEGPNTTHLTVADKAGNVVSYTFAFEQTGGSGITVPGRGFILNNELTDFNFTPGTANSPAARKRPRSSMAPTIVSRNGKPVVALGSPGGASIITTVFQVMVNRFERGMTLPEAIAEPRASQRNAAATEAEPAFTQLPEYAALQAKGEVFKSDFATPPELGTVAGVAFLKGGRMQAASEPVRRGGGSAMVVSTKKPRKKK